MAFARSPEFVPNSETGSKRRHLTLLTDERQLSLPFPELPLICIDLTEVAQICDAANLNDNSELTLEINQHISRPVRDAIGLAMKDFCFEETLRSLPKTIRVSRTLVGALLDHLTTELAERNVSIDLSNNCLIFSIGASDDPRESIGY